MLHIDFINQYNHILDDHSKQPQPTGYRKETEVKAGQEHPHRNTYQRQRQDTKNDDRFTEITEQPYQDNH